jgi:anti-sigma factor (TIGR02949 family)
MPHNSQDCREVFELLSEYLDLELPPDACEQIARHIADCPPCVEFAESLWKTVDLCRTYDHGVMPDPLSERAKSELERAWKAMMAERSAS